MSILRVVQDGVEFFTVEATGVSGMSETSLSRLVGIAHQSVHDLIQNISAGRSRSKCFKPFAGRAFIQQAHVEINGKRIPINIVSSQICSVIINYYAFISDSKTETAYYSSLKFAEIGIERWIQGITGWRPPIATGAKPIDLTDIRLPIESINILTAESFSSTVYRLFLHIQKLDQQGDRPNVRKICTELNITRPTYHKHIRRLYNLGLLPDWLEVETRNYPERFVRDWLHQQLGGQIEAPTPDGPIDLLTKEEVIEVKAIRHWKEAIGHVITKCLNHPERIPCIMLFGETSHNLEHIEQRCEALDIQLGFRSIRYAENMETKELELSFAA
jgi:hypothetical protein